VGEVRLETAVASDHALQVLRLLDRQVVLGAARRAGEVHVLDLVAPVILRAPLQVGMADHADLLQHGQGPVHGRCVDRGKAPLHSAGHILRGDVPVGPQHLIEDGFPLRGDPVPPLAKHGHHAVRSIHEPRLLLAIALQVLGWLDLAPFLARSPAAMMPREVLGWPPRRTSWRS
jgi:hypothetical protein